MFCSNEDANVTLPFIKINFKVENFNQYEMLSIFKVEDDMELILDNKKYTVRDFINNVKVKSFNKIILKNSHVNLPINGSGKLEASESGLKLMLDDNEANNNVLKRLHVTKAEVRKMMKEKFKLIH